MSIKYCIEPDLIDNEGKCGKKSFPKNIQINI